MNLVLHIHRPDAGQLGSIWDAIGAIAGVTAGPIAGAAGLPAGVAQAIGVAGHAAAGLLAAQSQKNQQNGCFKTKQTDQGKIAGCLDGAWASYRNIELQGNPAQTLQYATQLANGLTDPNLFKQSDAYVLDSINVAHNEIAKYAALAGVSTTPTASSVDGAAVGTGTVAGLTVSELLLLGVLGLGLIIVLK